MISMPKAEKVSKGRVARRLTSSRGSADLWAAYITPTTVCDTKVFHSRFSKVFRRIADLTFLCGGSLNQISGKLLPYTFAAIRSTMSYGYKKFTKKPSSTWGRKTYKAKRTQVVRVQKPISSGLKRVAFSASTHLVTNAGWTWINLLSGISQGTADDDRIGSRISLKELQLRFLVAPQAALVNVVRSVVLQDNQADGVALDPDGSEVHDVAGAGQFTQIPLLCGFKDHKKLSSIDVNGRPGRFRLLQDVNKTAKVIGGSTNLGDYQTCKVRVQWPKGFTIAYASGASTGVTADMQSTIWWGTCGSQATGVGANIIEPYWVATFSDLS